jgi:hypothetical protein
LNRTKEVEDGEVEQGPVIEPNQNAPGKNNATIQLQCNTKQELESGENGVTQTIRRSLLRSFETQLILTNGLSCLSTWMASNQENLDMIQSQKSKASNYFIHHVA